MKRVSPIPSVGNIRVTDLRKGRNLESGQTSCNGNLMFAVAGRTPESGKTVAVEKGSCGMMSQQPVSGSGLRSWAGNSLEKAHKLFGSMHSIKFALGLGHLFINMGKPRCLSTLGRKQIPG